MARAASLTSLNGTERERGVVTMSAGNHAQAVAYHAASLGIPASVVMPVTTPFVKVAATKAYGAEVVLLGESMAELQTRAETMAHERNLTWVHPYDDEHVIAGQGTIALEMIEDVPDIEMLIIPIGGGGLISGIAVAAKALNPKISVVGAEAALYPSFWNTLRARESSAWWLDLGRRHRGEKRRQADAAYRARSGVRHCATG